MKNDHIDHHVAPPSTPTAQDILRRVADKLTRAGAKLPMTVSAEPSTIDDVMSRGLSLALCLVESELDTVAAKAPRDNPSQAALFSLPPIQFSAGVIVPDLPTPCVVTGDAEIDAVLWLREVIQTGQVDLIEKAQEAATHIKTPLDVLEKRYTTWLVRTDPRNWAAGMASLGFADLNALVARSIERAKRQQEARARFGDALFDDTAAERFCTEALGGVPLAAEGFGLDKLLVDHRLDAVLDHRPGTLAQCVLELEYWNDLYWLRDAAGGTAAGDYSAEAIARQDYVFRLLSRIPPRGPEEAADVLRYLASNDGMDRAQTGAILMNLVGAPEPYHVHEAGGDHA